MKKHGVKVRSACRTQGQHRSTQRKVPKGRADEGRLTWSEIRWVFDRKDWSVVLPEISDTVTPE